MKTQAKRGRSQKPAVGTKPKGSRVPRALKTGKPALKKKAHPVKPAAAKQPAATRKHSPPVPPPVPDKQQQVYDEAVRLFVAHKFERADALFQKVMQGPNRTLAHHAQVHSQICQKRLRPPQLKLRTAEDHYNYAVTMINTRRLKEATEHLEMALRMAPQADHLHYAMAATQALQGNSQEAYERLKTAIDLQPRNRILARGDADFAGILEYPPMASLLQIERWNSPKIP